MQSENFKWQLIARCLSNEASPEEITMLNEYLEKDTSLQQQYNILRQYWNFPQSTGTFKEDKTETQISGILAKANIITNSYDHLRLKRTRLKRRRIFSISFVAFVALLSGIIAFNLNKKDVNLKSQASNKNSYELVAQKGIRTHSVLPDGSSVWLNAGSVLTYNNFSSTRRQVYLKGEAFFDVVKDPAHPFVVHANSIDIKVLGTAFNVKSYAEDNKVEATLIRGLIQVTRQDKTNQQPVFLHPNEKLVIDLKKDNLPEKPKSEQKQISKEPAFKIFHLDSTIKTENLVETSWVYNKLEFRGDNFEELAKKLERWYNIQIFFADDDVKKLSFNGSFQNETVQQAFEALKAAVAFDYTIEENEVFIRSSKDKQP